MNLILPANLAQAILNYLAERPFKEVAGLIGALQQLQPAPAPAAEDEKVTDDTDT